MTGRILEAVDFHDQLPAEAEEGDCIWVGTPLEEALEKYAAKYKKARKPRRR